VSDRERDLVGLFVRDIDRVGVPARGVWRPAPRRAAVLPLIVRSLALATLAIALVVGAALAGLALREGRAPATTPAPSPTATAPAVAPSATATAVAPASPAATATPTPEPTRAGVLDERFGIAFWARAVPPPGVSQDFTTVDVRSETSATAVGRFQWVSHAVSPDGRSVAYWTPAVVDRSSSGPRELRVVSAAGGAPSPPLFTLPTGMNAGTIAWSADGGGLVVSVSRTYGIGPGPGASPPPPPVAELWTVDIGTGASERIATRADNLYWRPLAWDRARQVIGAVVTGEGGFVVTYDVVALDQRPARVTPTKLNVELVAHNVRASSDARYVTVSLMSEPTTLWWPLAAPEERKSIAGARPAAFRPGTTELWWIDANKNAIALNVATGAQRTTIRDIGVTADGLAFRPDGSALAVTARIGDPNAPDRGDQSAVVYFDLASGDRATVHVGATVVGFVRLR
jgi:hypothetical protein